MGWNCRPQSLWSAGWSRRIWFTCAISSERLSGSREIPDLDLVFLGVEVLLTAWLHGDVLGELEPAVDAVARPERGGEDESRDEGRPPAVLQVLVQDVRRVGEKVRTQVLADVCQGELGGSIR